MTRASLIETFILSRLGTPLGNPPATLASLIIANNTVLSNLPSHKWDFYNLKPLKRTALKNLASNRQIIIKPADKGTQCDP